MWLHGTSIHIFFQKFAGNHVKSYLGPGVRQKITYILVLKIHWQLCAAHQSPDQTIKRVFRLGFFKLLS